MSIVLCFIKVLQYRFCWTWNVFGDKTPELTIFWEKCDWKSESCLICIKHTPRKLYFCFKCSCTQPRCRKQLNLSKSKRTRPKLFIPCKCFLLQYSWKACKFYWNCMSFCMFLASFLVFVFIFQIFTFLSASLNVFNFTSAEN